MALVKCDSGAEPARWGTALDAISKSFGRVAAGDQYQRPYGSSADLRQDSTAGSERHSQSGYRYTP